MIKIYYQDNQIVVCEKPYGVSSQKSSGENMVDMLSEQLNSEIYPVHRLDTTTTGLMIFAKNDKIDGKKLYLALKDRGVLVRHFDKDKIKV